jgi:carotenoid cleavage dioxygenase-like enzyme
VRTGEVPVHEPIGRYHPFDGDGFIHSISFTGRQGKLSQPLLSVPRDFRAEQEAGKALWAGLMEPPHKSTRRVGVRRNG